MLNGNMRLVVALKVKDTYNNIDDVAWYYFNIPSKLESNPYGTQPVGTKAPSELGIYDMSGNVWEWCYDWYGTYGSSAQTNPQGAVSGSYRVDRGGSWSDGAQSCRSAIRNGSAPAYRGNFLGFRLASSTNQ